MKTCTNCKKEKPRTEYYKQSSASDGLKSQCIDCTKAKTKQYYYSPPKVTPMSYKDYLRKAGMEEYYKRYRKHNKHCA